MPTCGSDPSGRSCAPQPGDAPGAMSRLRALTPTRSRAGAVRPPKFRQPRVRWVIVRAMDAQVSPNLAHGRGHLQQACIERLSEHSDIVRDGAGHDEGNDGGPVRFQRGGWDVKEGASSREAAPSCGATAAVSLSTSDNRTIRRRDRRIQALQPPPLRPAPGYTLSASTGRSNPAAPPPPTLPRPATGEPRCRPRPSASGTARTDRGTARSLRR